MKKCELILHKYYISWTGFLLAFGVWCWHSDRLNQVFDMNLARMIN